MEDKVYFGLSSFENLQEGIRLYKMKDWNGALKEFLSLDTSELELDERMELIYYLGLCYTKLQRYDEALNYLEQVITAGGSGDSFHNIDVLRIYQCRMTLAYIYVITKRIKLAEFELNRLRDRGMESPLLYNTLAYAAWCQKRNKSAIELYERALEIDSNNATAMNSLGYILVDTGIDIMRGLRLCRKAVNVRPQNPAYIDSLGWAYYKSGEVMEARTWLRRALELAPNEKEIQDHYLTATGVRK